MREYKFKRKLVEIFGVYDVHPDRTFVLHGSDERITEIGVVIEDKIAKDTYHLLMMDYADMMSFLSNELHYTKEVYDVPTQEEFDKMRNSLKDPQLPDRNFAIMNIKDEDPFIRWYSQRILRKLS